ncbi:hypothetical protein MCG98_17875 [Ruminococcus sp. OA3]|uniref:PcsB-like coiled-coil domain-containing protein n=1 Tax=Ruminococcus sp. OA3 TaxID=2914164 RepID=UPI001F050D85|nr:hypothetical protein [Ruminococcus sp. OA3]MCH1984424.1 hypothetical protein [Ruminococcus sp. OA3]
MNRKKLLSFLLAGILAVTTAMPALAATTQDKIQDARAAKQQTESSLNEAQNKIENLESKKGESEAYLDELNTQLTDLKNSLEELQRQSEEKQQELEKVQAELEEAKEKEARQYEDMKLRIRYMYEQTNSGYLEMLFDSGSFSEFLNRADNISQISRYDRDMLKSYQETKETIAQHEETIKTEKSEIEALRAASTEKQGQVEELVQVTYNQINTYAADLQDAESEEAVLLNKISSQEADINALLKQAKDEEAAAKKAAEEAAAKKAAEKAAAEKAAQVTEQEEQQADREDTSAEESSEEPEYTDTENETSSQSEISEEASQEEPEQVEEEPESTETSSSSNSSSQGSYLGSFKLTAYCSCSKCCGQWSGGSTASGTTPTAGRTVAMGGIPFGTKLMINGQVYTVEDRGTAYGHVDIFMGSHQQALNFGMQYADVYIVG